MRSSALFSTVRAPNAKERQAAATVNRGGARVGLSPSLAPPLPQTPFPGAADTGS